MGTTEGQVVSVDTEAAGDSLAFDHSAGAGSITVVNAVDFNPTGGTIVLTDDSADNGNGLTQTIDYVTADNETEVIVLDGVLGFAFGEGTKVEVFPYSPLTTAWVEDDDTLEPIPATVPQETRRQYINVLYDGDRDDGTGVSVVVEEVRGTMTVVQVVDTEVTFDLSVSTGNPPAGVVITPVAPDSSPTPTTQGGPRQVFVRIENVLNPTSVEYELHVTETISAPPPTIGNPLTLWNDDGTTFRSVSGLPNGTDIPTPLVYDLPDDGDPLTPPQPKDYYFSVWAHSGDEYAPAPSPWVPGRMDKTATADIAANSVTADKLESTFVFSQTFYAGSTTGEHSEWDPVSMRFYNSAGMPTTRLSGTDTYIAGNAHLTQLETDSATLGGKTEGPPGGEFKLSSTLMPAPTVQLGVSVYPAARVTMDSENGLRKRGGSFTDEAANYFWTIEDLPTGSVYITPRNKTTGVAGTATQVLLEQDGLYGVGMTNAQLYLGRKRPSDGQLQVIKRARTGSGPTDFVSNVYQEDMPSAPGTGGYALGAAEPFIGVQRTTGDVLVAHRVQGAQVIGGLSYDDQEIMVRRYSASAGTGSTFTMTLNKTIKTSVVATKIRSVIMDAPSGTFDLPASAGDTALYISGAGLGVFGAEHIIKAVQNAGSVVSASNLTGATGWYGANTGGLWDGSSFWSTLGDIWSKYGSSAVANTTVYHAYSFTNGVGETPLSPPTYGPALARYKMNWAVPTLPPGVTKVRIYESLVASPNNRFERVGEFTGTSGSALLVVADSIQPPAGAATNQAPTTSTLSNGSAYKVSTADPDSAVFGDGTITARDAVNPTDVVNLRTMQSMTLRRLSLFRNVADQSVSNNTQTVVQYQTDAAGGGLSWDGTNHWFQVPAGMAGTYDVAAMLTWRGIASATGFRYATLEKYTTSAGTWATVSENRGSPSGTNLVTLPVVRNNIQLLVGDRIRMTAIHTQGAALGIVGSSTAFYLNTLDITRRGV